MLICNLIYVFYRTGRCQIEFGDFLKSSFTFVAKIESMKVSNILRLICFLFIPLFVYSFPSSDKDKEVEEGWEKGNRSGGYPFGIEYENAILSLTFYQSIENIEISVLPSRGTPIHQATLSPGKGEVYTVDLSECDETFLLRIQLPDGSVFATYY